MKKLLFLLFILPMPCKAALQFVQASSQTFLTSTLGSFGANMNSGFTISFWAIASSAPAQTCACGVLNLGITTALNINFNRGTSQASEAGSTSINFRDESGTLYAVFIAANNVYDGNWHNLIFAVTSTNPNSIKIYLDGISQTLLTGATGTPSNYVNFSFPWDIGGQNNRGVVTSYSSSTLDDFRIYNRVLSAGEISTIALFRNRTPITTGLVGWWKMDDGPTNSVAITGTSIKDSSSNFYVGTSSGSPTFRSGILNYRTGKSGKY